MGGISLSKGVCLDFETYGPEDLDTDFFKNCLQDWDIHYHTQPSDIAVRVKDAHVVVSNKVLLTRDIIEVSKNLKLIAVAATGINNVDMDAAKDFGVTVCNVTGYATSSVVQHVFSMILALSTGLCKYHSLVQAGGWQSSKMFSMLNFPITELAGKSIGIVGYGELGKGVAKIARAFGMDVLVAERPSVSSVRNGRLPFETVIKQADIVTLHCPLTPETENLITSRELSMMKESAFLINTARGGIVNEHDLAEALCDGVIAGAGVDVLSKEPPVEGNPLLEDVVPNIIITPHIAWASREARQRVLNQVAENIIAFAQENPRNVVTL